MAPQLHQRVRKLFDEALDRPEAERLAFLEAACSGDAEVFQAVARLLVAHGRSQSFLGEKPSRPQRIGRYAIVGELGRGSMGIVYDAVDSLIGRKIALKVIHVQGLAGGAEADSLRERLFREARSGGALFHPGIVVVFDVGQEGETAFFAMERVDGPSLQELLASGRKIERSEALDILRQAAVALDYAHQHGVIHRDIKPANIMLEKGVTVKVADFSIAKADFAQATATATGMVLGTPSYMSPEQIEAKPLDGRSDQFSLAVVAFELLTGTRPFSADSIAGLAHKIVYEPRPSAQAADRSLPAAVDEVFGRGLAKSPGDRYASCAEFVAALVAAVHRAPAPVISTVAGKSSARTRLRYWVAGGMVAVALILAAVIHQTVTPAPKPPVTRVQPPPAEKAAPPPVVPVTPVPEPAAPTATEKQPVRDNAARGRELYEEALVASGERRALLRQAADLGEPRAMVDLGEIYREGSGNGTKDEREAMRWFRKAADAGSTWGMVYLGAMYELGTGNPEDDSRAVYWYQKASEGGNPDAMFDLGTMFENGRGVAKNLTRARSLYRQSAALGNTDAKAALARLQ